MKAINREHNVFPDFIKCSFRGIRFSTENSAEIDISWIKLAQHFVVYDVYKQSFFYFENYA